jgi:parvulin-like peptidyl-prolyl isomerase
MKYRALLLCLGVSVFAQVPPTEEMPADTVVAKIQGKDITAGDIRKALREMPIEFTQLYRQNPQVALQQMYVMQYLADEAEKIKLDQDPILKRQIELLRANVLASAMLSHENNYYQVPEKAVQDYYNKNQAKYQEARIKVIYIAFKPAAVGQSGSLEEIARATAEAAKSGVQRSEDEARKLAEDLVKQIRAGADFAKLVAQYSDDAASKASGGDFGVVNVNSSYSPEIKQAVLALKQGEVTDPLRQSSGFYIIRVEEKKIQPVDAVAEPIRQELRQAHVNEWFQEIRKKFEPTVIKPEFFAQPSQAGLPAAPARPGAQGR